MTAFAKDRVPAPDAPMPKAVVDALPNPLIVLDEDERICLANVAAEDYFQASSNVLLRHRLGHDIGRGDLEAIEDLLHAADVPHRGDAGVAAGERRRPVELLLRVNDHEQGRSRDRGVDRLRGHGRIVGMHGHAMEDDGPLAGQSSW